MRAVWEFFSKIGGKTKAKCNICHLELAYQQGSTTSLKRHVVRRHVEQWNSKVSKLDVCSNASNNAKAKEGNQQTLRGFIATKSALDPRSTKLLNLTRWIVKMIAVDLQPISILEDHGFRGFAKEATFFAPNNSETITLARISRITF